MILKFTYWMEVLTRLRKMGVAATPMDRSGRAVRLWIPETITVNPYGHIRVATVNRLAVIVKKRLKWHHVQIFNHPGMVRSPNTVITPHL